MAKPIIPLTQQRLRELLHYDGDTGLITRLTDYGRWNRQKAGNVVGSMRRDGYMQVNIDGSMYLSHRVAWAYVHGKWPVNDIDHIDGNRTNNRISNLREATRGENLQNKRRAQSNSASGMLGVSWDKARSKWTAEIKVGKTKFRLGRFDLVAEAQSAYLEAKRRHHPFGML